MSQEILFTERQGFNPKWIRSTVFISIILALALFLLPLFKKEIDSRGWLFVLFAFSALAIFILNLRLETMIKTDGIYVRYSPVHLKYRFYPWSSIEQCYVRTYNPLKEYGGWGIRYGFRNGKAFNFSGSAGLQLVFKDGRKLLIGTNKPGEMSKVAAKMGY